MPVATKDFAACLKFLSKAVVKTPCWTSGLLFIRPKELFVWDGEDGAKFPLELGVETTIRMKDVEAVVGNIGNEFTASLRNESLFFNEHEVGKVFTQFGKMPNLDKQHSVIINECSNLIPILQVATQCLDMPGWMEQRIIISEKAVVGCDGISVFHAENKQEWPLFNSNWKTGGVSLWCSIHFCKLLAKLPVPKFIRAASDVITARFADGSEIISLIKRFPDVDSRIGEFLAFEPKRCELKFSSIAKRVLEVFKTSDTTSMGLVVDEQCTRLGFESPETILWENRAFESVDALGRPKVYVDKDRMRRIMQFANAYDQGDILRASRDAKKFRYVRFYGACPSPFTLALGVLW